MRLIAAIVLAVVLPSPFGEATGAAIDDRDGLAVEVSVEVRTAAEAVLFRPFSSFEELPPTALRDLADGRWGAVVVLPTAENWFVVFEVIAPDGQTTRSDTTTLVELGVDPVVVAGEPAAPVSSSIDATTWWLLAAAILGLGALAALAWWTFGPEDRADVEPEAGEPGEAGDDAGHEES
ncbi:MAG: hypothetical protein JRE18_02005 [Deltaproteobacteria bacterium]|jgi:hypothetical protein|nr:hypothetical protein [Deltaproteobacteria bacterium]